MSGDFSDIPEITSNSGIGFTFRWSSLNLVSIMRLRLILFLLLLLEGCSTQLGNLYLEIFHYIYFIGEGIGFTHLATKELKWIATVLCSLRRLPTIHYQSSTIFIPVSLFDAIFQSRLLYLYIINAKPISECKPVRFNITIALPGVPLIHHLGLNKSSIVSPPLWI